ncbi:MAG: ABC transporter ATP-binding protein, partial [Clostridia bacterium]|nr:ABC transporter ATP-binding protein [Clostridia bacterium]
LYARLAERAAGRSAVFITHRLASTRFCDRIAVFSGGRLAQYGTHEALCREKGLYAELYDMQASLYAAP